MLRSLFRTVTRTAIPLIQPHQMLLARPIVFGMAKVSKKQKQKQSQKKDKQQARESLGGNIDEIDLNKFEQAYNRIVSDFKEQLTQIKMGKLQASALANLEVKIGNQTNVLQAFAQVATKNVSSCVVSPFDSSHIQPIEKSIKLWNDTLELKRQENMLLVTQLALGKDVQTKMIQRLKKLASDRRDELSRSRTKTSDQLKKYKKLIPEDRFRIIQKQAKDLFDQKNAQIDKLQKAKEKQLQK